MSDDPTDCARPAEPPAGVPCPQCGSAGSAVVRTRPGAACVRRWRTCAACAHEFRTAERVEAAGSPDRDAA